ncbi:AbrB/MazE/SpoVT family DNA-binding domain-containing protein [Sandaracinobacteroides hominis]|uniref:AbrB/MazE/SpoVT family DNA-binding domain-containing protein n=1 Tax=Sandaracinobacteroides hominis TaxID=2780086 RepID=UPI0018F316C9|nr:AbrB/MazE/SpoVT family DNA-binding domain-containing protein [Sandaracinobacteroides hominis]
MPAQTRTFKSGNSEAVRLPKDIGFGVGTEVEIARVGDRIILTRRRKAELTTPEMIERLRSLPRPTIPTVREPFEYPDRPGLFD